MEKLTLLALFTFVPYFYAVEYSDLEYLGVACPLKDSCEQNVNNFTDRNCECDSLCRVYDDCCINARVPTNARFHDDRQHCIAFGDQPNTGVYAVNECPWHFSEPWELRTRCNDAHMDYRDPLMSAPVTDAKGGKTYKSMYCAECNNVPHAHLIPWNIKVHCDHLAMAGWNQSFVWRNLRYNPTHSAWGVLIGRQFYSCELSFELPVNLETSVRFCRANTVSSCPSTWKRTMIRNACDSYMAVVYDTEQGTSYKNVHCAICNGKVVSRLTCYGAGVSSRQKTKSFSFALLMDVNRSDGEFVGVSSRCPKDEKYDPFFKKCRKQKCSLPGFTMVKGKCVKN